jgi:hypothetical protein
MDHEHDERGRNALRGAIAEMTLRVTELSTPSALIAKDEAANVARRLERLETSWLALMSLIQPEPEPTRRECPHCHRRMRQIATRCLYCLGRSAPPDAEVGAP